MKKVLITGHTSGLGLGFSDALRSAGWQVFGLARGAADAWEGLRQQRCDLARLDAVGACLDELLAGIERLDLAILNAGILGRIQPLADTPMTEIRQIMDVNVWANKLILDWFLAKPLPPAQALLISSGAAVNLSHGWGGYALSKAALNALTGLYAHELTDTHLTALAPGLVDTGMQDYLCAEVDSEEFPSVLKLKRARGTAAMPKPAAVAAHIVGLLPRLKAEFPSGSFVDVRDFD